MIQTALETFVSTGNSATLIQGLISSAIYLFNPHVSGNLIPAFFKPASFTLVSCRFSSGIPLSSNVQFGKTDFGPQLSMDKADAVRAWAISNRLGLLDLAPPELLQINFNFSNIPEDESQEYQLISDSLLGNT